MLGHGGDQGFLGFGGGGEFEVEAQDYLRYQSTTSNLSSKLQLKPVPHPTPRTNFGLKKMAVRYSRVLKKAH